ncbi:MAG: 2-C-methyl-D-erythritol 4-phosphate cytidylyltransferase [Oscillospiraceae bacterium]|nr:2-C-methyl-D-erythritol 4-phosphate cytidylyltransferase [Oscillospiraceae bacterium]
MRGTDKLFVPLLGLPVIARTLSAFQACGYIDEIVVVTSGDLILPISDVCKEYGITKATQILLGGETRTRSVYNGLMSLPAKAEFAAVHDGARPLITPELISDTVKHAYKDGAAAPVVELRDTVKRVNGEVITATVDRGSLAAVQTPQVFQLGLIKGALTKALSENWVLTDDTAALERLGMRIRSVPGRHDNIKITVPEDIFIAEALLSARGIIN